MYLVILVLLIVMLAGLFPRRGAYSESFGYAPTGLIGVVLLVLVVLYFTGHRV